MSDDDDSQRGTGALPPPGLEWQEGKTAATIRFVNEAEAALDRADLTDDEKYILRHTIEFMKRGDEALTDWETVDDWLERLRDHYP